MHGAYSRRRSITVFLCHLRVGCAFLRRVGDGDVDRHHRNLSANQLQLCAPTITRNPAYIKSRFGTYTTPFLITHFLLKVFQTASGSLGCVETSSKDIQKRAMCADCATASSQNDSTKTWMCYPDDLLGVSGLNVQKRVSVLLCLRTVVFVPTNYFG